MSDFGVTEVKPTGDFFPRHYSTAWYRCWTAYSACGLIADAIHHRKKQTAGTLLQARLSSRRLGIVSFNAYRRSDKGQRAVFMDGFVAPEPVDRMASRAADMERKGARILLADDLDLNRKLIADMLGFEGHEVDCVADGAEAVKAASVTAYDLILMDMIMPIMDGLEATVAIRALSAPNGDVPIVALTANAFREHLDACLAAGMDATVTKPMSMNALTSAVEAWRRKGLR